MASLSPQRSQSLDRQRFFRRLRCPAGNGIVASWNACKHRAGSRVHHVTLVWPESPMLDVFGASGFGVATRSSAASVTWSCRSVTSVLRQGRWTIADRCDGSRRLSSSLESWPSSANRERADRARSSQSCVGRLYGPIVPVHLPPDIEGLTLPSRDRYPDPSILPCPRPARCLGAVDDCISTRSAICSSAPGKRCDAEGRAREAVCLRVWRGCADGPTAMGLITPPGAA